MEPRISLVTLGVADLARSRRFYEDGLGWRPSAASVATTVFYQLGGLALALYGRAALAAGSGLGAEAASGSGFGGIALAHNVRTRGEVDAVLAEAERAGGRVLAPAKTAEWGGYTGCFADPDGHVWEIAWNPHFALDAAGALRLPE
jgi:uncharacterized protein